MKITSRATMLLVAAVAACGSVLLAPTASAAPAVTPSTDTQLGDVGVLYNCGTYPENKPMGRSQAMTRAQSWINARVPYSQAACHNNAYGDYRTDCSGFVSMAWGLRHSYTTATLHEVSYPIARADLKPGDALLDAGSHVALFLRWADAARTQPVVREQAGPNGAPTVERTWSAGTAAQYQPVRYNNIREDGGKGQTVGVYRPGNDTFYLRTSNTTGDANIAVQYGSNGDTPIVGDWNGDGIDTIGVYKPLTQEFHLRNSNTPGNANIVAKFGNKDDIPIAGDWDGNGTTTIGVYRPATRMFYMRNSNTTGDAEIGFTFGNPGDKPVVGDWDGNRTTTIGVYRPGTATFYLRNHNYAGPHDGEIQYGSVGNLPLIGNWDGDAYDTLSAYAPATRTFFLRNSNTRGDANITFTFGNPGDLPLAGNWS